jgi:hypothetical protein
MVRTARNGANGFVRRILRTESFSTKMPFIDPDFPRTCVTDSFKTVFHVLGYYSACPFLAKTRVWVEPHVISDREGPFNPGEVYTPAPCDTRGYMERRIQFNKSVIEM